MKVVDRFRAAARAFTNNPTARRSAFKAEEISRLTMDWITSCIKPDKEIRRSAKKLRGRARQLKRDTGVIQRYCELLQVNVIGPVGIALRSRVRKVGADPSKAVLDRATNDEIERGWYEWSCMPITIDGKHDLTSLSHILLDAVAIDGEVLVRKYYGYDNAYGLALQIIDADQLDETYNIAPGRNQNEVRMGVEVTAAGKPVAYHIWTGSSPFDDGYSERKRILADEIIHLYRPRRGNQTRGLTWLHPVMWLLRQLQGYIEAEVVAARTSAAKMGFFSDKDGAVEGTEMGTAEIGPDGKPMPLQMDAAPGTLEDIGPKIFTPWDPQHPSGTFDPFVKAIMREIASGLGMSYVSLANDLTAVSFSSIRQGLIAEHDHYRTLQRWWITAFLEPLYREWLSIALLKGALRLPSVLSADYLEHKWNPRGWDWVDPLKDVQATALAIGQGLASRTGAMDERGGDFEETLEDLKREKELAAQYGVELAPPPGSTVVTNTNDGQGDGQGDGSNGDANSGNGSNGKGRSTEANRIRALSRR